jgi:hypothetical protein
MEENHHHSSNESVPNHALQIDSAVEDLREILFGQQSAVFEGKIRELEQRVTDRDALVEMISPVLGDIIRRRIQDSRDEMIEALYPIIGQVVVRAVTEAIRDLVRSIDARMRSSLNLRGFWQRWRARLSGISDAEIALRESLPFAITEILLIHRETGLLLCHVSRNPDIASDSDLVSGMLTAIGDFVQDAFGRGRKGQLDEIQYGEQRILIEAAQYAYLAVAVDGIESAGFRAQMREQIIEISQQYENLLRHYDGDPMPLAPAKALLHSLLTTTKLHE